MLKTLRAILTMVATTAIVVRLSGAPSVPAVLPLVDAGFVIWCAVNTAWTPVGCDVTSVLGTLLGTQTPTLLLPLPMTLPMILRIGTVPQTPRVQRAQLRHTPSSVVAQMASESSNQLRTVHAKPQ